VTSRPTLIGSLLRLWTEESFATALSWGVFWLLSGRQEAVE
jgi:hypothetical protein